MQHSKDNGHNYHWILDDNIEQFNIYNNNNQIRCDSGVIFTMAEKFVERYTNIAMAGFQYDYFLPVRAANPPLVLNTRIYSCILINNEIPFMWRGRYNEDTDLSLRCLKDGWCTILFNMFVQQKTTTMKLKGGNTDTIYAQGDNRYEFAKSLQKQHPDVAKIVWRYNRWHHEVDYGRFKKNKLKRNPGVSIDTTPNEYGLLLKFVK